MQTININKHPVLRFRVSFDFNLLGAFLAFSSFSAGLGKRRRKPLGAHQERISIAMKENTAVCDLQPNYVSCIGNST
jgi:hypothetical protein